MNIIKRILLFPIIILSLILPYGISAIVLKSNFKLSEVPNIKSASVLPIGMYKDEVYAILSREVGGNDKRTYDDFSGGKESNEHPVETAAREFYEEAMLSYTWSTFFKNKKAITQDHKINIIKDLIGLRKNTKDTTDVVVQDLKNGKHPTTKQNVTFIAMPDQERFDGIINNFYKARTYYKDNKKGYRFIEKDRIALVKYDTLLKAIADGTYEVEALVIDPKTNQSKQKTIPLRRFLVKKLKNHAKAYYKNQVSFVQGQDPIVRFYAI